MGRYSFFTTCPEYSLHSFRSLIRGRRQEYKIANISLGRKQKRRCAFPRIKVAPMPLGFSLRKLRHATTICTNRWCDRTGRQTNSVANGCSILHALSLWCLNLLHNLVWCLVRVHVGVAPYIYIYTYMVPPPPVPHLPSHFFAFRCCSKLKNEKTPKNTPKQKKKQKTNQKKARKKSED